MFNLQKKLIIELNEGDLWVLVSCLRKSIIYDLRANKLNSVKVEQVQDAVKIVNNNYGNVLSYIENIYRYLGRGDLYEDFKNFLFLEIQNIVK